ncbi:MAG: hypothetical protein ACSHYF_15535 [Verrucomicrobiaceae bacterium]
MTIPLSAPAIYMMVAGVLVLFAIYCSLRVRSGLPGRRTLVLASLPGLLQLGLFYSLAVHMYVSLGDWPESIGTEGFSGGLIFHAELSGLYFSGLLFGCTFVWPILLMACLGIERLRRHVPGVTIFAVACYFSFMGVLVGPEGFLSWCLG